MQSTVDVDSCLTPACNRAKGRCRGLCNRCYDYLARCVQAGELSWADLEAEGRAKAADQSKWHKRQGWNSESIPEESVARAFGEGCDARLQGQPSGRNPFVTKGERTAWGDGWRDVDTWWGAYVFRRWFFWELPLMHGYERRQA